MKKLVFFLSLLALSVPAATIYYPLTSWVTTDPVPTNYIRITQTSLPTMNEPVGIPVALPHIFYPTNGIVTNSLSGGIYRLEIQNVAWPLPLYFSVPTNDVSTYDVRTRIVTGGSTIIVSGSTNAGAAPTIATNSIGVVTNFSGGNAISFVPFLTAGVTQQWKIDATNAVPPNLISNNQSTAISLLSINNELSGRLNGVAGQVFDGGVTFTGDFIGGGNGLTNINPANIVGSVAQSAHATNSDFLASPGTLLNTWVTTNYLTNFAVPFTFSGATNYTQLNGTYYSNSALSASLGNPVWTNLNAPGWTNYFLWSQDALSYVFTTNGTTVGDVLYFDRFAIASNNLFGLSGLSNEWSFVVDSAIVDVPAVLTSAVITVSGYTTNTSTALLNDVINSNIFYANNFPAVPIIWDDDMSSDPDTIVEVSGLAGMQQLGLANAIGIVKCQNDTNFAALTGIEILGSYFGLNSAYGQSTNNFFNDGVQSYVSLLTNNFPSQLSTAATNNVNRHNATLLYRRLLAGSRDHSVALVISGQLNDYGDFLSSPADAYSTWTGAKLATNKLMRVVFCGGGNYANDNNLGQNSYGVLSNVFALHPDSVPFYWVNALDAGAILSTNRRDTIIQGVNPFWMALTNYLGYGLTNGVGFNRVGNYELLFGAIGTNFISTNLFTVTPHTLTVGTNINGTQPNFWHTIELGGVSSTFTRSTNQWQLAPNSSELNNVLETIALLPPPQSQQNLASSAGLFRNNGASLTNIPAAQLTGTYPAGATNVVFGVLQSGAGITQTTNGSQDTIAIGGTMPAAVTNVTIGVLTPGAGISLTTNGSQVTFAVTYPVGATNVTFGVLTPGNNIAFTTNGSQLSVAASVKTLGQIAGGFVTTNAGALEVSYNSTLHTNFVNTQSADYNMTANDRFVLLSGNHKVVLPSAAGLSGWTTTIICSTSGTNLIKTNGVAGQSISGLQSITNNAQYNCARLVSDGANWWIVGRN